MRVRTRIPYDRSMTRLALFAALVGLPWYLLAVGGVVAAMVWGLRRQARATHRRLLRTTPLSPEWRAVVEQNVSPYVHLPPALQTKLEGYINLFLDEKGFEGCGGQEITDEVRVTIAAQACLLLIGRDSQCYPRLRSILVYPHTYVAGGKGLFGGDGDAPSVRLGESWQTGVVVLAWDSVCGGIRNFDDGHNVVLHEFSHQLDQEDGSADGTPLLDTLSCYGSWSRCLGREYQLFLKQVAKHRRTVIDHYGATNAAEFFATATEAFFEKPEALSRKHPDLYAELQQYYHLDPVTWG